MKEALRISAKNLGAVALPDFCPRCFWIQVRCLYRLPFQIFPGIFSSIDAYTKRVVHGWLDEFGRVPEWLSELGDIECYLPPPHHSKFHYYAEAQNIVLTGSPDAILRTRSGSHIIIDYKTAKFTDTQDELYPMYEAQLNAYAMIGASRGYEPVSSLALMYAEPVTDEQTACHGDNRRASGFAMPFEVHVKPVTLDAGIVTQLLDRAGSVAASPAAPPGVVGCKNCRLVDRLIEAAT